MTCLNIFSVLLDNFKRAGGTNLDHKCKIHLSLGHITLKKITKFKQTLMSDSSSITIAVREIRQNRKKIKTKKKKKTRQEENKTTAT